MRSTGWVLVTATIVTLAELIWFLMFVAFSAIKTPASDTDYFSYYSARPIAMSKRHQYAKPARRALAGPMGEKQLRLPGG